MQLSGQILVVGPVFMDSIYAELPQMPELGKEVYGKEHALAVGGMAITAIGIARLGWPVSLATAVGTDFFGDILIQTLKREGVGCGYVQPLKGQFTNSTTAIVHGGDRAFVSYSGAELAESKLVGQANLADPDIRHIHLSLREDPKIGGILQTAKERKITTSLVTGWDGVELYATMPEQLKAFLVKTDLFFCNELEAKHLSGQEDLHRAMEFFSELGCHPIISMGAQGAITFDEDGTIIQAIPPEIEFLDPTGAGDSLSAGCMVGRMMGWDWQKTLQLGVVCGSLSTRALGGITAFPKNLSDALSYFPEHR